MKGMRAKPDDGLRPIIRQALPQVHWTTIESGATEGGIPDLNGCFTGTELWIECKATYGGWAVKFRPLQLGWHARRYRAGGQSFVAVRRHRGAEDELWLYYGRDATELSRVGLRGIEPIGLWIGGKSRWDWEQVLGLLCTAQPPPG